MIKMVGSRKCKVCTVSGTNHISINDTFFDKKLREVVEKLCEFELEERKITAVFICQQCTRLLLQTEFVLERVRESFKNLGKNVKITRVKSAVKKPVLNSSQVSVGEQQVLDATPKKDTSIPNLDETLPTTKPTALKRKLELKANDISATDIGISSEENETGDKSKLAKTLGKLSADTIKTTIAATTPKSESNTSTQQGGTSKSKKRKSAPDIIDGTTVVEKKTPSAGISKAKKSIGKSPNVSREQKTLANGSMVMPAEESPTKTSTAKERWSMNDSEAVKYNSQDESFHKVKTVNCVICKGEFHSKTELNAHFEAQHSTDKPKQCNACEMEFKSLQKYESHIRNEKCKIRKFQCQHADCGRRFSTKQKLEIHDQSKHA